MSSRLSIAVFMLLCGAGLSARQGSVSQQQADAFTKKLAIVTQRGIGGTQSRSGAAQRTPFTEGEVNSWFAYRSSDLMPTGVSDPRLTMAGDGKLRGTATVDLDTIAKRKSSGSALDPWAFLGGRLPVTVSGVLRTQNGMGQFELQEATVSGVPVPTSVLQDIVAYYSKSSGDPEGVRLDGPFKLPSQIKQIEVGQGQAVVVQ